LSKCPFIKPGGERCGATAMRGYDHCYGHRPDLAEERRRNASKGGRSGGRGRGGGEIAEIKTLLSNLTDRVIGKEGMEVLGPGAGAVAAQLINTRLRAVELERKIREQEEIITRLEALESQQNQGGRSWRQA
jgi:hypothetical protein